MAQLDALQKKYCAPRGFKTEVSQHYVWPSGAISDNVIKLHVCGSTPYGVAWKFEDHVEKLLPYRRRAKGHQQRRFLGRRDIYRRHGEAVPAGLRHD